MDEQIRLERVRSVEQLIDLIYMNMTNRIPPSFSGKKIAQDLVEQINLFGNDKKSIRDEIAGLIMDYDKAFEEKLRNTNIDEIVINNKLENIYDKIAMACNGDIVSDKQSRLGYRKINSDKILDVRNLSTGVKHSQY